MVKHSPTYNLGRLSAEEEAKRIRTELINRLDELWSERLVHIFRRWEIPNDGLIVMQEIQVALFPEEFAGEHSDLVGLLPRNGPPRCGAKRLKALANLILAAANKG